MKEIDLDFGDLENCFKIKTEYHTLFFENKKDYDNLIGIYGEEKVEGFFDNCEQVCNFIYILDFIKNENIIKCEDWIFGATDEDNNFDCFFDIYTEDDE